MSNTVFQIRRSNTSASPGTTLNSGELGYSFNTNSLFIGAQTGVGTAGFRIGGAAFQYIYGVTPGTVNATASIIVDANLFYSTAWTSSLAIQTSAAVPGITITSISNNGGSGYLGANVSGGGIGTEFATTAAIATYVTNAISTATGGGSPGGSNTNIQYNNSGSLGASTGFVFNYLTNTATIGNTLVVGTSTINSTVSNLAPIVVGANASLNTGTLFISANLVVNGTTNASQNATMSGTGLVYYYWLGNTTVNTVTQATYNASVATIGNSIVNSTQNSSAFSAGANAYLSTTQLFISANAVVNGTVNTTINTIANGTVFEISYWNGNTTVNTYSNTWITANNIIIGNSSVNTITNSTAFSGTANNASNLGGTLAAAYVQNTFTGTLTGNVTLGGTNTVVSSNATFSANAVFSGANVWLASTNTYASSNVTLAGTNTVITSNTTFTGGLITAASANLSIQNISVTGNLTVSGTVTTINTSELIVNSNFIQLADLNKTTDTVDEGFFGTAGNSSVTYYPGIVRVASLSTLQNPYFYVFSTKNNPNTASTIDLTAANTFTGTLQAYLAPWGAGGGFIVNSTAINITANSTVSSALVANTLTLSTALSASYGGTGQEGGYTAGDVLYATAGTTLSKLNIGTNGYVMQVTSNLPAWGVLDGGTF